MIILSFSLYYLSSPSYLNYSTNIIELQYIDYLQSSVILISYLSAVLHPNSALSVFTEWWQFLPFIRISTLRTPHATCIFMSHMVSLVIPSPLNIRALHFFNLRELEQRKWTSTNQYLSAASQSRDSYLVTLRQPDCTCKYCAMWCNYKYKLKLFKYHGYTNLSLMCTSTKKCRRRFHEFWQWTWVENPSKI